MPIKPIYQNPFPDDPTSYTAGEVTPSRYNEGSQIIDSEGNIYTVDDLKNYNYYYVNVSTGADTNTGLSPTTAFETIAHAVSLAGNGCKIILANGTYPEYGITISNDIEIIGTSESGTIINGATLGRILNISAGCTVTISNLTIENGKANYGGGINNLGQLILNNVTVTGCNAPYAVSAPIYGGGIWNEAVLKMFNCNFTNNTSLWAGALGNDWNSYCEMTGCTFTSNSCTSPLDSTTPGSGYVSRAGAVMQLGYAKYTGCTFTTNSAFEGAAVTANSQNELDLNNCTFTNNTAISSGAAINVFHGTVNAIKCTFTGNNANIGATIYLDGQSQTPGLMPNALNLEQCTFTNNVTNHNAYQPAYGTGACIMSYDGQVLVKDCTFTGNASTEGGSVIYQETAGTIDCFSIFKNCTMTNNTDIYGAFVIMGGAWSIDPFSTYSGNTGSSGLVFLDGGYYVPNYIWRATSVPTYTGIQFYKGDECINSNYPSTGTYKWICTTTGVGSAAVWTGVTIP